MPLQLYDDQCTKDSELSAENNLSVKIQYNSIQYNSIQYNTIQFNTIQYNSIQYNTIQYNTIQYNTIQYNTIQLIVQILTRGRVSDDTYAQQKENSKLECKSEFNLV